MEASLSRSFDYLSSSNPTRIRKGLRQVEGVLAQICLRKPAAIKRHSLLVPGTTPAVVTKSFEDLKYERTFKEIFKLQQNFQWNIVMRLVSCLERLLGKESNGQNDLLLIQSLELIHGVLLIHPPSRELFSRELYLNLFLDLLDPQNCPAIQSSTILALMTSLLDTPQNTRTFERIDGLLVVTSLYKARTTTREVKDKLVEFLYVYLMPETKGVNNSSANVTALPGRKGQQHATNFDDQRRRETVGGSDGGEDGKETTSTTVEKRQLLGRYLDDVEDVVWEAGTGSIFFREIVST